MENVFSIKNLMNFKSLVAEKTGFHLACIVTVVFLVCGSLISRVVHLLIRISWAVTGKKSDMIRSALISQ